jgi:hypothetical protein
MDKLAVLGSGSVGSSHPMKKKKKTLLFDWERIQNWDTWLTFLLTQVKKEILSVPPLAVVEGNRQKERKKTKAIERGGVGG